MAGPDPFFHLAQVNLAIEDLASSKSITLFVGSGTAKDRGGPDWNTLSRTLLQATLMGSHRPVLRSNAAQIAELLATKIGDPLLLASMARHETKEQQLSNESLHSLMQHEIEQQPGPGGMLASGIALLALVLRAMGADVCIITTNYDNYIERASLKEYRPGSTSLLGAGQLIPAVSQEAVLGPNDVAVYHIHGIMSAVGIDGPERQPVFCERDYSSIRGGWQEALIEERLGSSTCLFLGTSMRDPYFAHCLNRTLPRPQRTYAVIPRQGETWMTPELVADPELLDAVTSVVGARLRHLGVEPLYADYYSQVSQFCFEVINCVSQGPGSYSSASPHRYGQRLKRWAHAWRPPSLDLRKTQLRVQAKLNALKAEVTDDYGLNAVDERYKIELWARSFPDVDRSLTLWASSESALLSDTAMHHAAIEHFSPYLAVRTFAQGHVLGPAVDGGVRIGRWQRAITVPIWLDADPWFHLPVGVIGLLSTGTSKLHTLEASKLTDLSARLAEEGARLLSPTHAQLRALDKTAKLRV